MEKSQKQAVKPVVPQEKVQVWVHTSEKDARSRRVLLLKTTTERGSFWQPVTGSVESKESFEEAALREAREETGLDFTSPLTDIGYEFSFESRRGPARERAYALATKDLHVKTDPKEHVAFQWVSPRDALTMIRYDSNREALILLLRRWGFPDAPDHLP